MFMSNWFYKLIKRTLSMRLAKLSEIKRVSLFSKIIIWSKKLSDNKCNIFLLFWFKLLFYSQKHVFELYFWLHNFTPIETKINKKLLKQIKQNV